MIHNLKYLDRIKLKIDPEKSINKHFYIMNYLKHLS